MTAATEPEEIPGLFGAPSRAAAMQDLREEVARLVEQQRQRPEPVEAATGFPAILAGLVPMWIHEVAGWTWEARKAAATEAADLIASGADRVVSGESGTCRHRRRPGGKNADDPDAGDVLNAIAMGLAIGAHQPGGATYHDPALGRLHWCVEPHPGCPNNRPVGVAHG